MDQFKMLVTKTDLQNIKKVIAKAPEASISLLKETHIQEEFWEIEILCLGLFQLYQVGIWVGYSMCNGELMSIINDQHETLGRMLDAAKKLESRIEQLQNKIKNLNNAN